MICTLILSIRRVFIMRGCVHGYTSHLWNVEYSCSNLKETLTIWQFGAESFLFQIESLESPSRGRTRSKLGDDECFFILKMYYLYIIIMQRVNNVQVCAQKHQITTRHTREQPCHWEGHLNPTTSWERNNQSILVYICT